MADRDLIPELRKLKAARVVTVGDVMVDRWVRGRVERISPEAPVPVFVQESTEDRPGGAANVTANLTALGITGYDNVLIGCGRTPCLKERFIVGRQQIFRRDVEHTEPLSPQGADDVVMQVQAARNCNVLVLSDYGKGMLTPALCNDLTAWAHERKIPVVVDPKGPDWSKYYRATVITPNQAEADACNGDWPKSHILLTRGDKGMQLWPVGASMIDIPARRREVYDVTGAGDTVVAVLAAGLSVGLPLEKAARIANAAAGVVVGKPGTATCSLEELEAELCR